MAGGQELGSRDYICMPRKCLLGLQRSCTKDPYLEIQTCHCYEFHNVRVLHMIDSFRKPRIACLIGVLATIIFPPSLDLVATRCQKDGPAFGICNADPLILMSLKSTKRFLR